MTSFSLSFSSLFHQNLRSEGGQNCLGPWILLQSLCVAFGSRGLGSSGLCWGGLEKEELSPGFGPKDKLLRTTQSWEWWPSQGEAGCVGAQPTARGSKSQTFPAGRGTSHLHRRTIIYPSHSFSKKQCTRHWAGLCRAQGQLTDTRMSKTQALSSNS